MRALFAIGISRENWQTKVEQRGNIAKTKSAAHTQAMHFPKFWTKANEGDTSAWGWSDSSVDDAKAKAVAQLQKIRNWISAGGSAIPQRYGYPGRPMREEVLREFQDGNGQAIAAVSRNSYGCLVLNTVNMLFVDIDLPGETRGGGLFASLFGRKKEKPAAGPVEARIAEQVQAWLATHPAWGWRVYRTCAGMRLLATHSPVEPEAPSVGEAFAAFDADPLYRGLCAHQKCFRARLTPKHWRCKVRKPPGRWPWESEKAEAAFQRWEQGYLNAAKDYATCRLTGHFGVTEIHPDLRELVEYHDKATRTDTEIPLA